MQKLMLSIVKDTQIFNKNDYKNVFGAACHIGIGKVKKFGLINSIFLVFLSKRN